LEVKEQFSKGWRSYCGGKPEEKPEGLSKVVKDGALPTVEEVAEAFGQWVQAWNRGACGQDEAPEAVYKANLERVRRAPERLLAMLCMRTSKPLLVRRGVVRLFGREYEADELLMMEREQVFVRYDPAEIGRVFIYDLEDRFVCEARNRQLLAWGADEQAYREAQARVKKAKAIAKAYLKVRDEEAEEPDALKAVLEAKGRVEEQGEEPKPVVQMACLEAFDRYLKQSLEASRKVTETEAFERIRHIDFFKLREEGKI
jgi:hypothetical protein